jgi:hypothetical protein
VAQLLLSHIRKDISQNFRSGPPTRASYPSPALDTTDLSAEQARDQRGSDGSFGASDWLGLRPANDFSDTALTLLLQLQVLQPVMECYFALGTGKA